MAYVLTFGISIMKMSQTTKTLLALVASMTIGTFTLALLQTEPICPPAFMTASATENPLEYASIIRNTSTQVQADAWDKIVYHSNPNKQNLNQTFHFIIKLSQENVIVEATDLWKKQLGGKHTNAAGNDWNSKSIGIYIQYQSSNTSLQNQKLTQARKSLCTALQDICDINIAMVYSRKLDLQ